MIAFSDLVLILVCTYAIIRPVYQVWSLTGFYR